MGVGPNTSKQLGFPDTFAGPFNEREKDVKGATSEADGFACLQQETPAGEDLKLVEREGTIDRRTMRLCHCSLARKVYHQAR